MSGAMLEAYLKAPFKAEDDRRTLKETPQMIWDSLPQGPIDKAVRLFKAAESRGWSL